MSQDENLADHLDRAIRRLQESYMSYMSALKGVLDLGDANVDALVRALSHKHANPVAKALGLMMYTPAGERAIPILLDWLIVQSPMYPEVLEALVRAGDKAIPTLVERINEHAAKGDDEAVRHLLDLACRVPDSALPVLVPTIIGLLKSANPHVREASADAIWRIGLPHGRQAVDQLLQLATNDGQCFVRNAAADALVRLGVDP
jgi:HEAT repeat protein